MQQISKLLIEKLAMFLMAYGNTPNSIMGESLAHLLHEKSLPTCLHLVKPASANPTEWTTNSSNAYIRSAADGFRFHTCSCQSSWRECGQSYQV